ncbi:hypothetical protein BDP27DRAFT_1313325 [Rhodocollybia butyracea]|uniref:Uncharacterized protein n=1 Tax=Rhodocollybia butyracea TaxID=206335 RepID=A0A9P5UEP6_9AGAR|nr:hypothetical protein BDP27DRAFT_1313325 [Rhodocollybia butyracea]
MLSNRPAPQTNVHKHTLKTPSRALAENRLATGTVNGKKALQTPFQSKTPFQKPLFTEADTQLKGGVRAPARPFLDKTPFPNRIATAVNFQNPIQTPFLHTSTPDSAQRPSSTRRHVRVPRKSQKFETPVNTQNHWDISDDNIPVVAQEPPKVYVPEDDFDEIEYMPPNTLDLPYQPPFDFEMPDYKVLGKSFMDASRKGAFYEPIPDVEIDIKPEDIELCNIDLDFSTIPNDDPFLDLRGVQTIRAVAASKPKSTFTSGARPVPVPTRTALAGIPSSRPLIPKTSRPGTSASLRAPSRVVSRATTISTSKTTIGRPMSAVSHEPARTATVSRNNTTVAAPTKVSSRSAAPSARHNTSMFAQKPTVPRPVAVKPAVTSVSSGRSVSAGSRVAVSKAKAMVPELIVLNTDNIATPTEDFMFDV